VHTSKKRRPSLLDCISSQRSYPRVAVLIVYCLQRSSSIQERCLHKVGSAESSDQDISAKGSSKWAERRLR